MVGDLVVGVSSNIAFQSTGDVESIPYTNELNSSVVSAISNVAAVTYDNELGTHLNGNVTVTGQLILHNSTIGTQNMADGSITDAECIM
jgi:hypothetical protein